MCGWVVMIADGHISIIFVIFGLYIPLTWKNRTPGTPPFFLKGGVCVFEIFPKKIIQVFLLKRKALVK